MRNYQEELAKDYETEKMFKEICWAARMYKDEETLQKAWNLWKEFDEAVEAKCQEYKELIVSSAH